MADRAPLNPRNRYRRNRRDHIDYRERDDNPRNRRELTPCRQVHSPYTCYNDIRDIQNKINHILTSTDYPLDFKRIHILNILKRCIYARNSSIISHNNTFDVIKNLIKEDLIRLFDESNNNIETYINSEIRTQIYTRVSNAYVHYSVIICLIKIYFIIDKLFKNNTIPISINFPIFREVGINYINAYNEERNPLNKRDAQIIALIESLYSLYNKYNCIINYNNDQQRSYITSIYFNDIYRGPDYQNDNYLFDIDRLYLNPNPDERNNNYFSDNIRSLNLHRWFNHNCFFEEGENINSRNLSHVSSQDDRLIYPLFLTFFNETNDGDIEYRKNLARIIYYKYHRRHTEKISVYIRDLIDNEVPNIITSMKFDYNFKQLLLEDEEEWQELQELERREIEEINGGYLLKSRKTCIKKGATKKVVATKKGATKKVATKKVATKKVATKKVATKKGVTKKVATKKGATKKVATKKVATKKVATKKGATKKVATKKGATKKGATKKGATKKVGTTKL